MEKEYKIGSVVIMKKQHPYGENKWEITRVGADIKIKCVNCNHEIMMDRLEFEKKLRRIVNEEDKKD